MKTTLLTAVLSLLCAAQALAQDSQQSGNDDDANTPDSSQNSPPTAPPDSALPTVGIVAADPVALAGASSAAFIVFRKGDTNAPLTVQLDISGSATNGVDYAMITNALTLAAGAVSTNIVVQPIQTNLLHRVSAVILTLDTNANYQLARHHFRAKARIIDVNFVPGADGDDDSDGQGDQGENPGPGGPALGAPPVVSMTMPTNQTILAAGTNVTLQADATDADDAVVKVTFFADEHRLGSVTNAPYSLVWSNLPAGHFELRARAVDQSGLWDISEPVNLVVTNATDNGGATLGGDGGVGVGIGGSGNAGAGAVGAGSGGNGDQDQAGAHQPNPDANQDDHHSHLRHSPNGQVTVTLNVSASGQYQIEFSRNLRIWVVVGTAASQNGQVTFVDPNPRDAGHGFYRAVPVSSSATP